MKNPQNRFVDDLARLMQNAAGMADGARREVEDFLRARLERILGEMDLVGREEFEAVRDMARRAREDNERLAARIEALEATLREAGLPAIKGAGAKAGDSRSADSTGSV